MRQNWLRLNRDAWGIENGLHQRLDVSDNDDRCRVRNDNAMLVSSRNNVALEQ
jgi:predicted transposase YbfD/YdcC